MTTPDASTPPPAAPEATPPAPPPVAVTPPTEAAAEPVATPAPAAPAPRVPRQLVSDETLASWQATIAEARAQRQRRASAGATARERAAAFRELRAALRRLEEEPEEPEPVRDPIRDDALAVAVHEAPARLRRILAATLAALTAKRRR